MRERAVVFVQKTVEMQRRFYSQAPFDSLSRTAKGQETENLRIWETILELVLLAGKAEKLEAENLKLREALVLGGANWIEREIPEGSSEK